MTQQQNTAVYGAVGAAVGFGAAKLLKSTGKMKWAMIIGGAIVGGLIGNKKTVMPATTTTTATPAATT